MTDIEGRAVNAPIAAGFLYVYAEEQRAGETRIKVRIRASRIAVDAVHA
jgi:hypothetical protein